MAQKSSGYRRTRKILCQCHWRWRNRFGCFGKSERQCREIIKLIRQHKNKEKHQVITVHELCEYLGINPDTIAGLLR